MRDRQILVRCLLSLLLRDPAGRAQKSAAGDPARSRNPCLPPQNANVAFSSLEIRRVTQPLLVNFTAFPSRLIRICRNLPSSPRTQTPGIFLQADRSADRSIFLRTRFEKGSYFVGQSAPDQNPKCASSILPASILERSRMSLIRCNR